MAIYLTPGPSEPYPKLREFMEDAWSSDVASISHRGKAFTDIYRRSDEALRELLAIPGDYSVMFLGSATEAMERIVQGVVENHSHHFVNGSFSAKWQQISSQLGNETSSTRADEGSGFTTEDYDIPSGVDLVCLTQNETSTGVITLPEVVSHVARSGSAMVALDVVSSAPIVPIEWKVVDLAFFSVQKAFGLPAGLGVLAASPRAIAKSIDLRESTGSVGSYHSLPDLAKSAAKFQTPATPNVLGIYLLGRVAEDMIQRGIDNMREENHRRAAELYRILTASETLAPFVREGVWQSPTVVVADVPGGNAYIHGQLSEQGLIVGKGYKDYKDNHLRIANFPSMTETAFGALASHLVQFSGVRV